MIVTVNYEKQLREAYIAGAAATILHLKNNGPKPDADAYVRSQEKSGRPVPRFSSGSLKDRIKESHNG